MPALMRKTLRDQRRPLLGWTLGVGVYLVAYLAFYPLMLEDPGLYEQLAAAKFPGPLRDLMGLGDSLLGAGFLQLPYHLVGVAPFVMFGASLGSRAIADREYGALELVVTLPLTRRRLVLERFGATAVTLLVFAAAQLLVVLVLNAAAGIGVDGGRIVAAHTGLYLLTVFFGALALAVGAATGGRAAAMFVTAMAAVGAYLLETLGRSVAAIGWLRPLSPFHHYLAPRPLHEGWPFLSYLVLVAAVAVVLAAAVAAFDRRDVGV